MKKLFYFAAAAVALAACAKNEVIPVNSGENQEITFNVAPKTKGTVPSNDPSYTVPSNDPRYFNEANHFVSYAYFRGEGNKWPGTVGQIYIDAADISFAENKWKEAGSTYYWPKSDKSSLTFFAWSTNSASITLAGDAEVSCDSKSGISVSRYDVTQNENVDLLVADVAANKNANEDIYSHNGVPTLFRHKPSYLIFKVKTATNYASAGKEFALKSIKILGVDAKGTYSQNATATNSDDSYNTVGSWEVTDSKAAQTYFDVTDRTDPVVFGAADITLESDDNFKGSVKQKYYLPQTIDAISGDPSSKTNYTIEVVYTIKTTEPYPKTSTSTETTETVTKYIKASEIYGEKWEINKKYTCTLTFSLNEILWDPAVENWDEVDIPTSGLITI